MPAGSSKRARRRRRRRLRSTGKALQWLAVVPILIAGLVLLNAVQDDDDPAATLSGDPATPSSTSTEPPPSSTTTSVPGPIPFPAEPPGEVDVAGENQAPVVRTPDDGVFAPGERFAVVGVSVDDAEARATGGTVGVLLTVPTGGIYMDVPSTVVSYGQPGWGWYPMVGPLDGINRALATLELEDIDAPRRLTLSVLASDFGHGNDADTRITGAAVVYFRA